MIDKDILFKSKTLSFFSSVEESFCIQNNCNSKINILCLDTKACLLSYKFLTNDNNKTAYIYGSLLSKIIYCIEGSSKKISQVFITPFSKEISIQNSLTKIVSISADISNKYTKRACNDILLGFFLVKFSLKVKYPKNNPNCISDGKDICDLFNSNTLTFDDCPTQTFDTPSSTPLPNISQCFNDNFKNDCFSNLIPNSYSTRI